MIQAQCSIAVWKTFFLWMFKVFSLLSSYQIDPIFLLSITLLFLEMRSAMFKTKVKILFFVLQINVKHWNFLASLNYAHVTRSSEQEKNTPSIKCYWYKDMIGLFLTNLTAYLSVVFLVMSFSCSWSITLLTMALNQWAC